MAFIHSSSDYKALNVRIIISAINPTPRTRDPYPGSRVRRYQTWKGRSIDTRWLYRALVNPNEGGMHRAEGCLALE